ncbi:TetR/AcrR family transcriptional regulator [Mycobacterium paraffinicum]|uniref:TetR/AcrR family transcriptional regulator n=1 Tax=Mycobacterium paraffinicum TaxID=53378 RepID=UPI00355839FD|nr:TetR/AcrR family transcriptional regulator [Mycobacterium paraffinicum]
MFAERPYEDIFVEDIAARAGVSRALLYHYFPSKRGLYAAIFKRASHRLSRCTNPDPEMPLAEQLASGLEAHIRYFADHPFEAIAVNRGALSDDPAIQTIIAEELNVIGQRLTDKLVAEGHPRDSTEIAVRAWLAFVRAACVEWVQSQRITQAGLSEICLRAFGCVLGHPTVADPAEGITNTRLRLGPSAASPSSWRRSPLTARSETATHSPSCGRPPAISSPKPTAARRARPDHIADGPLAT